MDSVNCGFKPALHPPIQSKYHPRDRAPDPSGLKHPLPALGIVHLPVYRNAIALAIAGYRKI